MTFPTALTFFLFVSVTTGSRKSRFENQITIQLFRSTEDPRTFAVLAQGLCCIYEFQANVAHAYQILVENGVPRENIITLMVDDVADDISNPYPGKLYNEPDGPDVYAGIKVGYRLYDANINNLIAVLEGNASAVKGGSGRILERYLKSATEFSRSGPNDHVFVYMSAFGGEYIQFLRELLTPTALNRTLTNMFEKKKYDKLVFYLDNTIASTFFQGILSPEINVYAVASSASDEYVSCPLYCGTKKLPEDCLATEFSHYWMKDAETNNSYNETINEQFEIVRQRTQQTHVQRFGDLSIGDLPVAFFQGKRP